MKAPTPLSLAELAGAGTTMVGSIVVGLLLGLAAARWLGIAWATPIGIVLGFVGGIYATFRRLTFLT